MTRKTKRMASAGKKLEKQLLVAGKKLEDPPSSVDDLLRLLDQVENCLFRVQQSPPKSMQDALSPSLKALIGDKLLRHSDVDVKVAVASCISQITRITAPDAPYDDDQMKEAFRLIVSSFENLYDESSRSYAKRTSILATVAEVRSCLVMLDLECGALISEMFQHFMKTIREHHHPENLFSSIERIMKLVLEESEDISLDLLSPIIDSVKKGNEEVLPIARRFGERVLESCATRLKPYLVQAVVTWGISLDDYSDVFASICKDTSGNLDQSNAAESQSAKEPVEESAQVVTENAKEAEPPQQDDPVGDRSPKSVMSNGIAQSGEDDALAGSKSLMKPDDIDGSVQSKGDNLSGNEKPDDFNPENVENKKQKPEQATKRRGRKPNSLKVVEPTEGSYIANEKDADKKIDSKSCSKEVPSFHEGDSAEAAGSSENNKEINAKISSPKAGAGESDAVASSTPSERIHDERRSKKRRRVKKKDSSAKDVAAEDVSEKVSEGTCDLEVKPTRPSAKKGLGRSSDVKITTVVDAVKKGSGSHDLDVKKQSAKKTEERNKGSGGSSLRQSEDKKRSGRGKGNPEKGLGKSFAKDEDKEMVSSPKSATKSATEHVEETPKTNLKRKHTPGKKQSAKKTEVRNKGSSGGSSLRQSEDNKRSGRGKGNPEKGLAKSSAKDEDKEMVSLPKSTMKPTKEHLEETPKTNLKRKHTPGKENESNDKKYGEELVGTHVKVWWPEDKTFYRGVIDSFDSSIKKHKVLYDDGDQEVLNLKKEKWKIIQDGDESDEEEARDDTSHDEASADIMETPSQQPRNTSPAAALFKPTGDNIDIGWQWNSLKDLNDRKSVTCDFCGKVTNGGITRAKRHQMQIPGDVKPCPEVTPEVQLLLKESLAKKKGAQNQGQS